MKVSLSARRAWIEICTPRSAGPWQAVALRTESVDRNLFVYAHIVHIPLSLSARRAWIEICARLCTYMHRYRRSPQGERG